MRYSFVMVMTRRKIVFIVILCALLGLLCFAAWIGFRWMETASMACECENPMDRERIALWNPLRDREPERVAVQALQDIQSGNCNSVELGQFDCQRELRFKVVSWKATGRSVNHQSVTIRYWVIRSDKGQNFDDPVWVTLSRNGKTWTVSSIDLYY